MTGPAERGVEGRSDVGSDVGADVPADLADALRTFGERRPVLVALDFDGVLAPIVERPPDARPLPGVAEVVRDLAATDGVTVALVSGRARADLAAVSGLGAVEGLRLVGSHGAEIDGAPPPGLDDAALERLDLVLGALRGVAERYPGARVETKPSAAVLHTRQVARDQVATATREALGAVARVHGTHVTEGKEVVEVAVTEVTKGAAVQALREALGARGVMYVGDDVTDETVLASLGADDVGVKVGEGATAAAHRVTSPEAVRELLRALRDVLREG